MPAETLSKAEILAKAGKAIDAVPGATPEIKKDAFDKLLAFIDHPLISPRLEHIGKKVDMLLDLIPGMPTPPQSGMTEDGQPVPAKAQGVSGEQIMGFIENYLGKVDPKMSVGQLNAYMKTNRAKFIKLINIAIRG